MTENTQNSVGAPVPEDEQNPEEVAAAIARAHDDVEALREEASDAAQSAAQVADPVAQAAESEAIVLPEEKVKFGDEEALNLPAADTGANVNTAANGSAVGNSQAADPLPEFLDDSTRPYTAAEQADALAPAAETSPAEKQLTISADHPMAGFYSEAPVAPEKHGNRVAGLFIALLATVVFALVYAGVIALTLLPSHSVEQVFTRELPEYLLSPGYWGAATAFFFALLLLVLIFGRAGWWAYVLGGFFVGVAAWGVSALGFSFSPDLVPNDLSMRALTRFDEDALSELGKLSHTWLAIFAGLTAREVAVWFGAWIGRRGRRMTAKNKAEQAEYEEALAAFNQN